MKLIWIHGAPAAGKLTVAKYLHEHYGYKLFHNHLAVDLSLAIYDEFGDKDFSDFTNGIRRTVLAKAKSIGVSHLVITYMTCAESDSVEINKYLDFFSENEIEVYPIHLCPKAEIILDRSASEERQQSHKLSCQTTISNLLNNMKFLGINHENTQSIDNSNLTPKEVALKIVNYVK
ncbi:AAA family ATPase [Motilimonas sp. E26]|uniref:AAA family ATPase n=1 Tax=Motilimonas sp. E26 TaxID=2865674 RepID=UPI001E36D675|nr:AAA family ATPase [Motilimonas sp. E26]MCE0557462.1 AAA family ATPase [Motilimonas sp. E26]